jgi:hypothetical protein
MLFELVASSLLTIDNIDDEPLYEPMTPNHLYSCGLKSNVTPQKEPGEGKIYLVTCFQENINLDELKPGNTVQINKKGEQVLLRWAKFKPYEFIKGNVKYILLIKK